MIEQIGDKTFQKKVIEATLPVVVDFWADWCAPCLKMESLLLKVKEQFKGRIKVYGIDVDKNPKVVSKQGVKSLPTVLFFKNGEMVDHMVGVGGKEDLLQHVSKLVNGGING